MNTHRLELGFQNPTRRTKINRILCYNTANSNERLKEGKMEDFFKKAKALEAK